MSKTIDDVGHTRGSWIVPQQYPSEIENADGKTIASCWHEHAANRTINVVGVLECSLEESAANARLIAAAPELLEMAKWAEAAIAPFSREPAEKSGISRLRAAIAKAGAA
jgi:hypothetical protein